MVNDPTDPLTALATNPYMAQYRELSTAIGHAKSPQQYDLFLTFFQLGDQLANLLNDEQKWALYFSQFELVLQTTLNHTLPCTWRRACYETINKPLLSLQRIAKDTTQTTQLNHCYIKLNKEISSIFHTHPF